MASWSYIPTRWIVLIVAKLLLPALTHPQSSKLIMKIARYVVVRSFFLFLAMLTTTVLKYQSTGTMNNMHRQPLKIHVTFTF